MKILLATADLEQIQWASNVGLADGVVTSPRLLDEAADGDWREFLVELCEGTGLPVTVAVPAVSGDDLYRAARELAKLSDQIVVQLPLVEDAIGAMRQLRADGVRVTGALVYTTAQALLAAKAGATATMVALDDLESQGQDALELVRQIRASFVTGGVECDVVAVSSGTPAQFAGCALAGVDAIALTPAALRALLVHPLTDRALDRFLNDVSKTSRARQ